MNKHALHLADLSDAVLGRMVRAGLLTLVVDAMPPAREEAKAKAEAADTQREALLAADRIVRKTPDAYVLPAMVVKGVEIPALDLTEVSMGEVVTAKVRSPYNKARYRHGLDLLDNESTTWEVVRAEHQRMAAELPALEPEAKAPKAKKKKAKKGKVAVLTASVDLAVPAKVQTLMDTLGCSRPYAEALLTRIGS